MLIRICQGGPLYGITATTKLKAPYTNLIQTSEKIKLICNSAGKPLPPELQKSNFTVFTKVAENIILGSLELP